MQSYWLGVLEFRAAWDLQRAVASWRQLPDAQDVLLLLEHPPTITLGRGASPSHILATGRELSTLGVEVVPIDRGGDVTYHAPGQLVGYPICDLRSRGSDLHRFIRDMEQALINLLDEYGIAARRFSPNTGVWVGEEKVAAIGVRVSRWISTHGFALNVSTDLDGFSLIVPCGLRGYGVTSLERLLGGAPSVEQVAMDAARHFEAVFGGGRENGPAPPLDPALVRWAYPHRTSAASALSTSQ